MENSHASSLFQVNEVELVYRNKIPQEERVPITGAKTAYDLLMRVWDRNKIELVEQFHILLLDYAGNCVGVSLIATGGGSRCPVDPRIVFATALKANASSLILAHNHPSGNLTASPPDILTTKGLMKAGDLLEIPVRDHLIVSPAGYLSLYNEGLMPGFEP